MITTDTDRLTSDYLKRLDKALAPLPRVRRAQLVAEIAGHLATARAQLESPSDADLLRLFDRIGRPEVIAAEAISVERTVPMRQRWSTRMGLGLLPLAGFLIVLELICGVASVVHYISLSGITAKRRDWSVAFFVVVGAIGPVAALLLLFDVLRTGMTWRSRLALAGVLGSILGGGAMLFFIPLIAAHDILLGGGLIVSH